jgi:hypothetical protein
MDANNNQQQIKAVNLDPRSKKRVRFQSTKQRAQLATADIYRTYNRSTVGSIITSSATRENQVHHHHQENEDDHDGEQPALKKFKPNQDHFISLSTSFANELDLTKERNSSQLFSILYKEISPFVNSLPEILHHLSDIVTILLQFVLSPWTDASSPSSSLSNESIQNPYPIWKRDNGKFYVTNVVTTDVLHLLAVLAKDVQGEIHPYLFHSILPRIVYHLIAPLTPPTTTQGGGGSSGISSSMTLNVSIVEAAFRCLSYLFKYNNNYYNQIQNDNDDHSKKMKKKRKDVQHHNHQKEGANVNDCMDTLRRLSNRSTKMNVMNNRAILRFTWCTILLYSSSIFLLFLRFQVTNTLNVLRQQILLRQEDSHKIMDL